MKEAQAKISAQIGRDQSWGLINKTWNKEDGYAWENGEYSNKAWISVIESMST